MTFQLDTSGRVECSASFQPIGWAIWPDISPFAQGYIKAMFASLEQTPEGRPVMSAGQAHQFVRFSDLAPETLARIISDCEKCVTLYKFETADDGRTFWTERQAAPGGDATLFREAFASVFPLFRVVLNDAGKVIFE